MPIRYLESDGLRLLEELAASGRLVFTTADARAAARQLGIAATYVEELLGRLAESGWVSRLRRGLYAGTGRLPGQEGQGASIHPYVVATRLVQPSAVSHWSAMQHHGLTEQLPHSVTVTTPRKVVTPSMRAGGNHGAERHAWEVVGQRIEYVTVKPEHFFGVEEVWIDRTFQVPITDRERTVLDGFIFPRRFGGTSEVLGILEEHLEKLIPTKLVGYALRYGKGSVAKRLGWALEQLDVDAKTIAPLLAVPVSGYRALDPGRASEGKWDRRWRIVDNRMAPEAETEQTLRKP
jgi:predicted transcriptional regulator of viral defense system